MMRGFRVNYLGKIPVALLLFILLLETAMFSSLTGMAQSYQMQRVQYGEVHAVREVVVEDRTTGVGAAVGSTAGSVAGWALSRGGGGWLGGLVGGLAGGLAGHAIEKAARKKKGWELHIKLENGEEIVLPIPGKKKEFKKGDRVRMATSPNGKTQISKVN